MYDQCIYDSLMEATHGKEVFVQRIVPHVINGELQSLPPEVMQSLVTHFASKGEHSIIEKCVLSMDVTSLDVNQVARLCETHGMIWRTRGMFRASVWSFRVKRLQCFDDENGQNVDDATHGTTEDKEEMRFELSRKSARRLLLFSRESIAGRLFPPRFSEDMTVRKQNELDDDPVK